MFGQGAEGSSSGEGDRAYRGQPGTLRVLVALGGPAVLAVALYALTEWSLEIFAVATLVGACAFALGALLGFLFGIPQYLAKAGDANAADKASYQPNTNLTQVSDWLTKIIIGVGLVEFAQLTGWIGELGEDLSGSFSDDPATGQSFGVALVVGFFVIGFLVGYLYTRLRLQGAFTQADRGAFEELLEERNKADAVAVKLASQQLDPTEQAPPPEKLKEALDNASAPIKEQVLSQARSAEKQPATEAEPERARVVIEAIDEPPAEL